MLEEYVRNIPPQALAILHTAVKPTTIIYPGARNLAENLIASDGSIGIRITSDPFCKQLIEKSGKPIVSTSANISGEKAPGIFKEIQAEIRKAVDYVVNLRQDETAAASPSAILKLEAAGTIITLRP
jgi:L-threonylcarbamoyladenylate synthase